MKTGAVISAAGHKSSISTFNPMLPIGNTTVIRRIILTLKQTGVDPIVIITGADAKKLEKHVSRMQVICIRNENYETTQMLDSICIGLNYIEDLCDRLLVLPAKFPMLLPGTIKRIMGSKELAACPVYNGRRGHPVMIDTKLIPFILGYQGEGGLSGALRQPDIEQYLEELTVDDEGIIEAVESDADLKGERALIHSPLHQVNKLYLERDEIFFGPGIAQFMTLTDHTGSMQAACRQMNMSYTKGWKILKDAEKEIGYPLMVTRSGGSVGGYSHLTPKGRELLNRYTAMEKELNETAEKLFQKYFKE